MHATPTATIARLGSGRTRSQSAGTQRSNGWRKERSDLSAGSRGSERIVVPGRDLPRWVDGFCRRPTNGDSPPRARRHHAGQHHWPRKPASPPRLERPGLFVRRLRRTGVGVAASTFSGRIAHRASTGGCCRSHLRTVRHVRHRRGSSHRLRSGDHRPRI